MPSRFARLIGAQEAGAHDVQIIGLKQLGGGNARNAWAFDAAWCAGGRQRTERCVALCKAGAGQLDAELGREFRVLKAIEAAELPTPRALWLDEHGNWLGMPAFVMARGDGDASILPLLHTAEPAQTRSLTQQFLQIGARLHQVDWQTMGLDFLVDGAASQAPRQEIERWQAQYERHRLEPLPILASIFEWLRRHLPIPRPVALVHGDFRLGNFLYREGRVQLLLDWEMAHLGDPLEDIAWAYRQLWSPQAFLPLDAAVAVYATAAGSAVAPKDLLYYRIFSEAKFATISLTAASNFADGRTDNLRFAGRMYSVADCLGLCLDWIDEWEAT
jgi:aminoglycoside phosphotransferase (APT) family kinase protein